MSADEPLTQLGKKYIIRRQHTQRRNTYSIDHKAPQIHFDGGGGGHEDGGHRVFDPDVEANEPKNVDEERHDLMVKGDEYCPVNIMQGASSPPE